MSTADRVVKVIRKAIEQETKTGAQTDYLTGIVGDILPNEPEGVLISATMSGEDDPIEGIRLMAGDHVSPGDYIVVGVHGDDSWVEQILPKSLFSRMIDDYNIGRIGFSDGTAHPSDFGSSGDVLISGGDAASAYWGSAGTLVAGVIAGGHYEHIQNTPATTWSVVHNLGRHPVVSVLDSAGTEVIGGINHTSLNALTLSFSAAFSGTANMT